MLERIGTKAQRVSQRDRALIEAYWNWLRRYAWSRCPFCQKNLARLFDPVDLTGFWVDGPNSTFEARTGVLRAFCLLLGAVNLNGLRAAWRAFECRPGPDMPYVIARILEMPTMTAVVSCVPHAVRVQGVSSRLFFPNAAQDKVFDAVMVAKEYRLTLEDGRSAWDITAETYDYDLTPGSRRENFAGFMKGH